MNLPKGEVFNLVDFIPIRRGQTISKGILENDFCKITLFSLGRKTDISEEFYFAKSFFINLKGEIFISGNLIGENQAYLSKDEVSRGVIAREDSIYLEIYLKEKIDLENLELGKVISLKEGIDYVEGGIANIDLINEENVKFILMAFDEGQGLTPHSAPGHALVMALEGEADLLVGDETFRIKAGEELVFPKDIIHNVRAVSKFKMALLLVIK